MAEDYTKQAQKPKAFVIYHTVSFRPVFKIMGKVHNF